jgi:hypothetical protein
MKYDKEIDFFQPQLKSKESLKPISNGFNIDEITFATYFFAIILFTFLSSILLFNTSHKKTDGNEYTFKTRSEAIQLHVDSKGNETLYETHSEAKPKKEKYYENSSVKKVNNELTIENEKSK